MSNASDAGLALAGKNVVVLGVADQSSLAWAIAKAFAAQGARVAVHYHASAKAAEAVAKAIGEAGGEAFLVRGDVTKSSETARIVEETAAHFGGLDGLINNAGLMVGRMAYADTTDTFYDAVMDLNARSVIIACKTAIPWLKKRGGFIINTTSIAARNGAGPGAGLYGSAKAFVSNVTRGLAKELIGSGIRVNAVAPGVIDTPFHERYSTATQMQAMVATIPQGRAGTAEDCVGAYLFLASPSLSGYVVGQVIEVNGGQLMP